MGNEPTQQSLPDEENSWHKWGKNKVLESFNHFLKYFPKPLPSSFFSFHDRLTSLFINPNLKKGKNFISLVEQKGQTIQPVGLGIYYTLTAETPEIRVLTISERQNNNFIGPKFIINVFNTNEETNYSNKNHPLERSTFLDSNRKEACILELYENQEKYFVGKIDENQMPEIGHLFECQFGVVLKHFEGKFENGRIMKGKLRKGENLYEGEFKGGKVEGEGMFENEVFGYKGRFKDNLFHGESLVTDKSSKKSLRIMWAKGIEQDN